ncbi:TPA: hypothetical protein TUU08_001844 [Streptococcus equi subsp. zooepidemicus]|uniref:Uncharacterized protein n=1 Tax=Streptococcus equi subsp. zooepidemicus TaxID=40041 RepID=A0A7Z8ZVQ3_STRSZ|nr:hypothetical protein [Streptococcus equi]VEF08027.1 Uncharacterised protein [Streptococcus equi subsp. zooepidemicus]HEK9982711.1 hypothetical protein [Streptococcus equi subsp. zooepidemicus]HEL0197642.1 hypothetical protein [Streptococcus equi subsp. zooepidemicus]HEL0207614.1 hypothetical protein [Streptococcus equi subsp. zooepidemicus]HEL0533229.1 hypothetical protein [Streptococcus equi subsp. zooepidemicus]
MEHSQLTWEEVSQYEEVKGYGQQVWKHQEIYYLVTNEGGIAEQRVVYELPYDLFELLESGERSLGDVHSKLQDGNWPPTEEEKKELEKNAIRKSPTVLIDIPRFREYFTQEELKELIPIAEQQWIDWRGKLPDDYVSPLK